MKTLLKLFILLPILLVACSSTDKHEEDPYEPPSSEIAIYTVKFIDFPTRDQEKIENAVSDLSAGSGRDMTVESTSGSGSKLTYEIKWLRGNDSQHDVTATFKEALLANNLRVETSQSAPGIIWFTPSGFDSDDE